MPLRFSAFVCCVTTAALIVSGKEVWAVGYWNLPGTVYQCLGYGVGPGYHAPMVLGPVSCEGWLAHDVHRLPNAPTPYCGPFDYGIAAHQSQPSPLFQSTALPSPVSPLSAPPRPVLR
jgi:hypothetical protein